MQIANGDEIVIGRREQRAIIRHVTRSQTPMYEEVSFIAVYKQEPWDAVNVTVYHMKSGD